MPLTCPYCATRMSPRPNGTCPACDRRLPIAGGALPSGGASPSGSPPTSGGTLPSAAGSPHGPPSAQRDFERGSFSLRPPLQVAPPHPLAEFQRTLHRLTPRLFVTRTMVVVNLLIFGLMVLFGVSPLAPGFFDLLQWGANYGPKTLGGQWWRLFSCMFIHVGIIHLAVNMWVLWQIGRLVERLVGNTGFLVLYVLSGVGGSLASLLWHPATASAGASGAIFGLFGGLLGFVVLSRHSIPIQIFKSLVGSTVGFIALNVVLGLQIPAIDLAAHLGGFAAGVLCGLGLSQPVEPAAARRRPLRNLVVAAGGTAAVLVVWQFMPPPADDVRSIERQLETVERHGVETFNEIQSQLQQGELTARRAAERIESEIVPPWREMVEVLAGLENIPREERERFQLLTRYMQLRLESWQLWVDGLRSQDPDTLRRAGERSEAAEKTLQQLPGF